MSGALHCVSVAGWRLGTLVHRREDGRLTASIQGEISSCLVYKETVSNAIGLPSMFSLRVACIADTYMT